MDQTQKKLLTKFSNKLEILCFSGKKFFFQKMQFRHAQYHMSP